jgi:quercetin dioxygenase-like cupin family protein
MSKTTLIAADAAAAIPLVEPDSTAPASIVSRALLQTAEARVTVFEFAPGQELTTHTNRRRALIQILRGTGEFFFNDTWQRLEAGTFLHLPPNHPHAVRAPEAFSMLLTLCAEPDTTPAKA